MWKRNLVSLSIAIGIAVLLLIVAYQQNQERNLVDINFKRLMKGVDINEL